MALTPVEFVEPTNFISNSRRGIQFRVVFASKLQMSA
jgi:hypothetical protein